MCARLKTTTVTENTPEAALAKALYEEAFPEIERIGFDFLTACARTERADFFAYRDGDEFVGFAFVLLPGPYAYLLYTATVSARRNRGYGTAILKKLRRRYAGRTMILDIEPLSDEAENAVERTRRYRFYYNNGFRDTGYEMRDRTGDYRILSEGGGFDLNGFVESYRILPEIFEGTDIYRVGTAQAVFREAEANPAAQPETRTIHHGKERKMTLKEALEKSRSMRWFAEISRIPRGSFCEEKIVDFIEAFAKERGLWYRRDAIHNIIVRKDASPGRENEPPLVLQAHTDMVWNKEPWSDHDFTKDPIEFVEKDGWLMANGTTLGADDGAGVANILAILDEPDLSHPTLECIFTVQEENGMGGAAAVDLSDFKGKRMIGLDGILEGSTIYSATDVWTGRLCKTFEPQPNAAAHWKLTVSGLTSGHGALMIGSGRANAIKLAARLLTKIPAVRLVSFEGGGLVHVIPGSCAVTFTSDLSDDELAAAIDPEIAQIRDEYRETDPNASFALERGGEGPAEALSEADSETLITMLELIPVGAQRRTASKLEQVEGSYNLSIIHLNGGAFECWYVARTNWPASNDHMRDDAIRFAKLFGVEAETKMAYPGHHVPTDSPLTKIWNDVYKEDTGKDIVLSFLHSGLDSGYIFRKLKLEDLIVLMPTTPDVHTPKERVNIDSYVRTYEYLKRIIERC